MNLCMLETCMVKSCAIIEDKFTDLWSSMFWVVRLGSDLRQDKVTPLVEQVRGFSPSFFIMLIYEMFYYGCHNIALV